MFKELDLREAGGTYFSDVAALAMRLLDVLFFDIQLCASVVHSNRWGAGEGGGRGAAWWCSAAGRASHLSAPPLPIPPG